MVIDSYHKYKPDPISLKKIIKNYHGTHILHNTIYKVLLDEGLIIDNKKKKTTEMSEV
jgi:hypothetical protein